MTKTLSYLNQWLPGTQEKYLTLPRGLELRYVETGRGEPLLLIHTLRTQLDYFQKLVPLLEDQYRVILLDLPGHGHSTIDPQAAYDEPFFRKAVLEAIQALELKRFAIGGESIGGTLALTVAATIPDQITRVFALSPYDYGERFAGGVRRSKNGYLIGLFGVFGEWTIELRSILRLVLNGGFASGRFGPESLFDELVNTGNRHGYRRAEYQLHKHWRSWLGAKALYKQVKAPVVLLYGEEDWSLPSEREQNSKMPSLEKYVLLPKTGHFSALENPEGVARVFLTL